MQIVFFFCTQKLFPEYYCQYHLLKKIIIVSRVGYNGRQSVNLRVHSGVGRLLYCGNLLLLGRSHIPHPQTAESHSNGWYCHLQRRPAPDCRAGDDRSVQRRWLREQSGQRTWRLGAPQQRGPAIGARLLEHVRRQRAGGRGAARGGGAARVRVEGSASRHVHVPAVRGPALAAQFFASGERLRHAGGDQTLHSQDGLRQLDP